MSKITKRILSGVLSAGMILTAVCAMPFAANAAEETSATGVTTKTIKPDIPSSESSRLKMIDEENGRYSVQTYYKASSSYYDARESATEEQKQVAYTGGNAFVQYDLGEAHDNKEYDMKSDSATNFLDIEFYLTTHETTRASITGNTPKAVDSLMQNKATMQMLHLEKSSILSANQGICYKLEESSDKTATSSAVGYKALKIGKDTEHKVRFLMDCKNAKVYMFMDGAQLSEVSYPNTTIAEYSDASTNYVQEFRYIVFRVPTGTQCGVEALKLSDAKVTVYDNTSTATLQDVYESGLEEMVTTNPTATIGGNATLASEGTTHTLTCTENSKEMSGRFAFSNPISFADGSETSEASSTGLTLPEVGLIHFSATLKANNFDFTNNLRVDIEGSHTNSKEVRLQSITCGLNKKPTDSSSPDAILPGLENGTEYKYDVIIDKDKKAYNYINGVYCGESMYKRVGSSDGEMFTATNIRLMLSGSTSTKTTLTVIDPVVNTYYDVAGKNWTVDKVRSEVAGDAEVKYNTVKIADNSAGGEDITVNIYGAIEGKLVILAGYSDDGTVLTYATKLDNTKRMQAVKGVDMTDIDSMRVFIWNGTTLEPYDTAVVYTAPTSVQ